MARVLVAVSCLLGPTGRAMAQRYGPADIRAGTEFERYLRIAQLAGAADATPWTVRPWGPEAQRAAVLGMREGNPWNARIARDSATRITRVATTLDLIGNSALPAGRPAGPAWAGKGLTGIATSGVAIEIPHASIVHLRLAPVAFLAQNLAFDLSPAVASGINMYHDGLRPEAIDLPERFGPHSYGLIDPGDSELEISWRGIALRFGTAPQQFGPMPTQPLVLGPNGGGFANLSLGTTSWVRVPHLGTWSLRMEGGRLGASGYPSISPGLDVNRLVSAVAVGWQPFDSPILELSGTQFVHRSWSTQPVRLNDVFFAASTLVGGGRYSTLNDIDPNIRDNQQASVGVRSAFPGMGLELFGEILRNDSARDLFEALTEPDHDVAVAYGFQRVLVRGPRWHVFRAELVQGGWNQSAQIRPEVTAFEHATVVQGHTVRGELLAAPLLERTGGSLLGWDLYDADGRRTVELQRVLLPNRESEGVNSTDARARYSLTVERLGVRADPRLRALAGLDVDVNRTPGKDVWNLRVGVGYRY